LPEAKFFHRNKKIIVGLYLFLWGITAIIAALLHFNTEKQFVSNSINQLKHDFKNEIPLYYKDLFELTIKLSHELDNYILMEKYEELNDSISGYSNIKNIAFISVLNLKKNIVADTNSKNIKQNFRLSRPVSIDNKQYSSFI